jgi:uncharacterized protein (UPF0335 family)
MARGKRKTATAEEFNAEQDEVRQEAAARSDNVVDLKTARERNEARDSYINDLADRIESLDVERDGVNSRVKALYDEAEANGLDRKALKHHIRLRKLDADKRAKYRKTQAEIEHAWEWDAQAELFPAEALPGIDRPFMTDDAGKAEPGIDQTTAAAIKDGWLSDDELARNKAYADAHAKATNADTLNEQEAAEA